MNNAAAQTWERIRRHKAVTGAAGFLHWWRDELIGGLPDRWRSQLRTETEQVLIRFDGDEVVLSRRGGDEMGRFARGEEAAITAQAVQTVMGRLDEDRPDVYFLLERNRVLERRLVLPAATEENLDRVLGFEMDRHTPFKADQVHFDYVVEERLSGGAKIRVNLVLARREEVESIARFCRERGLHLHGIDVAAGDGGRHGVNLLPPAMRASRDRRQLKWNLTLAVAFLVLLYGVMWQSVNSREEALEEYQAELEALRGEANEVARLRKELEETAVAARFLTEQKRQRPSVVNLLAELTARLPDETWLQRVQLTDDKLQLSGQTPETARLLATLEASACLQGPNIRGAVTPDPQSGKERFTIEAQVQGEDC